MIKTFYVQIDNENIIRDIISFAHEGYIELTTSTPLPSRVMAGCYRLVNNELVYAEILDVELHNVKTKNEELQAKIDYLAIMTDNKEVLA